jgi:membrane-bound lytic murein transglycosylase D
MNRTSRFSFECFRGQARTGRFFLLLAGLFLALPSKSQLFPDSLNDNALSHFHSDPIHYEFHPELHPFDSLFFRYVPAVDMELIEDRVSCMDLDMPLVVNKAVCGFIHYFTVRKRNYTQTMLERKNYYFPIFEYYLRKYDMPDALKYLSIVESGLNYKARSKAGAVGLWQFMPGTGRDFRLGQSVHLDQRQNPWLATEAACKFLKSLYGTFQDWELALAAYNCGPGNVMKAMRRSGKRGFWEIYNYLPQETRSYVPQFHAVVYSMNHAREHNIFADIDSVLMTVPLDTFRVAKTFDLRKLELLLGMSSKSLQQHNPEIKTNVFPGGTLLVPGSYSGILATNLDLFIDSAKVDLPKPEDPTIPARYVQLKRGMKVKKLAERKGWDAEEFCRINRIHSDKILKSGRYLIPVATAHLDSSALAFRDSVKLPKADSGAFILGSANTRTQPKSAVKSDAHVGHSSSAKGNITEAVVIAERTTEKEIHEVRKGEGLFAIARQYGLELKLLRELNPKIGNQLHQGQFIRLKSDEVPVSTSDSAVVDRNSKDQPLEGSPKVAQEKKRSKTSESRRFYLVQKGDTLYSITRKFNRLTVQEIIRINKLKNKQIKPGQQLIVG